MQRYLRHLSTWIIFSVFAYSSAAFCAEHPTIMVSIKPFYNITAAVMQNVGTPQLLLKGNSSPHDYQLRPSEAQFISDADLIIWGGSGLESYLMKPITTMSKANLDLSQVPGLKLMPLRVDQNWQHDHHHDHHHGHEDPHFWLDPENAIIMASAIATELGEIDPAHAAQYQTNAQNFATQIRKQEVVWQKKLQPYHANGFIVGHDAYQYFDAYFDLNGVGSITLNPELPPSAKHIQDLQTMITTQNITCIFGEPQFANKVIETLIYGTKVHTGVLDPLGQDQDLGPNGYFVLIDNIVHNFVECNGGAI